MVRTGCVSAWRGLSVAGRVGAAPRTVGVIDEESVTGLLGATLDVVRRVAPATAGSLVPRAGPDAYWPGGGKTSLSSRRDVMPSLMRTFPMCHSTVLVLRKSSAPISGLVRPSRASRAMCVSWGVSSRLGVARRLRTCSPVASNSRRARSANASRPISTRASCASRSWWRDSRRRLPRRSHSPYKSWLRATSGRSGVRERHVIESV